MIATVKSLTMEKVEGYSYLFKIEFNGSDESVLKTVARCAHLLKCLPAVHGMLTKVQVNDDTRFELKRYFSQSTKTEDTWITMLGYVEELYSQEVKRAYLGTNGLNYIFLLYTHD